MLLILTLPRLPSGQSERPDQALAFFRPMSIKLQQVTTASEQQADQWWSVEECSPVVTLSNRKCHSIEIVVFNDKVSPSSLGFLAGHGYVTIHWSHLLFVRKSVFKPSYNCKLISHCILLYSQYLSLLFPLMTQMIYVFPHYHSIIGLYMSVVLVVGKFVREFFNGISRSIMFEELPCVDRVLKLCTDIFVVRETGEMELEHTLFEKLIFLYRSPETMIKMTREKKDS